MMTKGRKQISGEPRRIASIALITLVAWLLQGCTEGEVGEPDHVTAEITGTSQMALSADVMEKWARSCAQCHVAGQAGAPRTGNVEEWSPRLEKGQAMLLEHTIKGFNMMPALGYCMSCETSDFIAMIEFMSGSPRKESMQ